MDLFARARSVIDHRPASATTRHDASHETEDEHESDRRTCGPQAKVRALLEEMQTSAAWGEKEHEGEERRLLEELETCVVDAASRQALEKLPKRMCAYEFKPGDIAWNCKVCQVDETCVMCNDCFISSDHEDHEVFFYYTHSGGCCDCGDTEAWAPEGFCTRHKGAQDADPLSFLPRDVLVNSRECIEEVMTLVLDAIQEARFGSLINDHDLDIVREKLDKEAPTRRYSVIVHYNELQTSQEFATALNKAHPAIAYQMLKIVGETSSQKQSIVRAKASRTDVLELATSLHTHGIVTSIVSSEYKAKMPLINSLLQWLAALANLSDGLCRLICEKMCAPVSSCEQQASSMDVDDAREYPLLVAVILADAFLPKPASDALHSLLMALLADPVFKQAFAIAFTSSYRQLYREFAAGVGTASATILAFSVQFFNRATFVKKLVHEYDLLDVLVQSVLETLRKKAKPTTASHNITWETLRQGSKPPFELEIWDIFALGIQKTPHSTLKDVDLALLLAEAQAAGLIVRPVRSASSFLSLSRSTALPGRFELDVTSPVFVCRRYMSGLLDLRYVLQIDGISETFVRAYEGRYYAQFLLYLAYIQGACAETRRLTDHVELESRGWVVTVEFVSTASDVSSWLVSNAVQAGGGQSPLSTSRELVKKLTRPLLEAFFFWLASAGLYFPPSEYTIGTPLRPKPRETPVSCHFPLQRTLAQLIRVVSDASDGLDVLLALLQEEEDDDDKLWPHSVTTCVGFWHRVQLIEPVLAAIVWDAQVHAGLWVRNGLSVLNHSMNYGEPPFCARFRDLDLVLLQFSFQLVGIEWVLASLFARFGVETWSITTDWSDKDVDDEGEVLVAECLALLAQLASELPPQVAPDDALASLMPYLRRELVQRLCVGPCAHSDLSKISTEFFQPREPLLPAHFSPGAILDQLLVEICVTSGSNSTDKCQYRLKPELCAEYNPTFVHLTRKQHEAAHENWFQERLRLSKQHEHEEMNDEKAQFPIVTKFLPCPKGFERARVAILHAQARQVVYTALDRARKEVQCNLSILSRAVHLFTLQIYVVEDVPASDEAKAFVEWLSLAPEGEKPSVLELLLLLNPWSSQRRERKLEGDPKHEIGRGIDWLVHRIARLSAPCRELVMAQHQDKTKDEATEDVARHVALTQRRKDAQRRAMEQMQQRQAAFAEQLHDKRAKEEDLDDVEMVARPLEEDLACAMCHAVALDASFLCYVGFAQCSAALSRRNGGVHGLLKSTPLEEMHVGQDIPVHVRLCGHAVHHKCWEAYHTSQFQRAITGGHHRHALNAVDVTKKEFLCPLCKSISNVLIPRTTERERRELRQWQGENKPKKSLRKTVDVVPWLEAMVRTTRDVTSVENEGHEPQLTTWLDDGLACLCMAIHKVACGAMQKSQPEKYTTSACLALFHTFLCSFLDVNDVEQRRDHLILEAMRLVPLMLQQVGGKSVDLDVDLERKMLRLLYYGGSDVLLDGTIVLESEQPSTQTQTRKQSEWGKVRWPQKPLLLTHLGSVLMKGVLFAKSDESAVMIARLVVLARLVQTLLWYGQRKDDDEEACTYEMANDLTSVDEHVRMFVACFGAWKEVEDVGKALMRLWTRLWRCGDGKESERMEGNELVTVVACEVMPLAKIATFLVQTRRQEEEKEDNETLKPVDMTLEDMVPMEFVTLEALESEENGLLALVCRWVDRFQAAYDEMRDPHGVLAQWVTTNEANEGEHGTFKSVLKRDLHTMHAMLSVSSAGLNRTKFLRSLPRAYVQFYSGLAKRTCHLCHQFPARPAVCLLCGMLLCAATTCPSLQGEKGGYPDDANPGACTVHAKKCGRGSGVFLLVLEGAVLLVYWKLAAYVGSLYVDEYGEEFGERNRELSKGRPLYLNHERRDRLLRLWLRHEIPNEVVKIQNSSDRVIRNSHY